MIRSTLKKIAEIIIILVVLSFFVFALLYIAPGGPAEKGAPPPGDGGTKAGV